MRKAQRHQQIYQSLRRGADVRAEDLAEALGTSLRTIYRDMAELSAAGLPIEAEAGRGYWLAPEVITLPPLNLTLAELEALHIGISILAEADDASLRGAAIGLSQKLDAALPEDHTDAGASWALADLPVSGAEPSFALLAPLRAAIRKRQKVEVYLAKGADVLRPFGVDYSGRIWTLRAFSETQSQEIRLPLSLIKEMKLLPELFPSTVARN